MAQYCVTRQAIWPYIIMLLLGCFCLFVAFGAVDLIPQRQRQSPPDQTKEILLVNVVRLTVFFVCLFCLLFHSIKNSCRAHFSQVFVALLFVESHVFAIVYNYVIFSDCSHVFNLWKLIKQ